MVKCTCPNLFLSTSSLLASPKTPLKANLRSISKPPISSTSSVLKPILTTATPPAEHVIPPKRRGRPKKVAEGMGDLMGELKDTTAITRRPTLVNETSARDLVRAWGVDKMHDVTVVEPYPGPGGVTRALLELKNVKRVISIEESFRYVPFLESLAEKRLAEGEDPSRFKVLKMDPNTWEAYSLIEEMGLLGDVKKVAWDAGVNDSLFLSCQLPNNRMSERLFFQFMTTIPDRMWYFQYGRFKMGFLGNKAYFDKLQAPPSTVAHHKLAVLLPSIATLTRPQLSHPLTPPENHFHRPQRDASVFSPLLVEPKEVQGGNFDSLQYVTQRMFIGKGQLWIKGVEQLAPGAINLIPLIQERGLDDLTKVVNDLNLEEWAIIAAVFNEWPFRPHTLFDDGAFGIEEQLERRG